MYTYLEQTEKIVKRSKNREKIIENGQKMKKNHRKWAKNEEKSFKKGQKNAEKSQKSRNIKNVWKIQRKKEIKMEENILGKN